MKRKDFFFLFLFALGALLVHGYHPAAEDAEIYIPGIVHILHPSYYPFGREFFEDHARLTLFPNLVAWTVRITHLSLYATLFLWHCASIFLFLLAAYKIASKCFPTPSGRWGAVALLAALLTIPVAGTALYIFDQYFNPRSISAFAVLFALDAAVEKKYWRAALWLAFTAVIHPLMVVFGIAFILLFAFLNRRQTASAASAAFLFPLSFLFKKPSAAYWQALRAHRYYFLLRWTWYEWLGIVAPLGIIWWFSRMAKKQGRAVFARLAQTVCLFGLLFFAGALLVTIPPQLEILDLYQPMRSLQLVYVFLAIFAGGLLGEFFLKNKLWRWLLLFVPLCAGMYYAQLQLFPATRHVEWPGLGPRNPWLESFLWIRKNTPTGAIFALDPEYMSRPDENHQGFRAYAERSRLADAVKDWSAAAMFPGLPMADHALAQIRAASGWPHFRSADFERLKKLYGVSWVVLERADQAEPPNLSCPYQNRAVLVCQVP